MRRACVAAILVSVVLVCVRIASLPPNGDEALVAVPAWNLAHHGFAGTTTVVEAGSFWKGINRRTYNILPGGILYLASWFAVLPASSLATRVVMSLWGPVLLLACFLFIRRITGSLESALLATALIALEYSFILETAMARVDVMTAALGMAALASYSEIRLRSLNRAIVISFTLVVFVCLTHPQGLLYVFNLIILAVYLDRTTLSKVHVTLALIPISLCATLWLSYIAQAPSDAFKQLSVNSIGQDRLPRSGNPFRTVRYEIRQRYLKSEGISVGHTWIVKLSALLIPMISAAAIFMIRSLRSQKGLRLILLLAAQILVAQTFLESSKAHVYLIHIEVLYCALIATVALYAWHAGKWQRSFAVLAVATYLLINLGGVALRLKADFSASGFRPALAFLAKSTSPHQLVFGESSLWFDCCGSGHNLIDDPDLGARSGLWPDYFVENGQAATWKRYIDENPALFDAIEARLRHFELLYDYEGYRIYRRRE